MQLPKRVILRPRFACRWCRLTPVSGHRQASLSGPKSADFVAEVGWRLPRTM